MSGWQWLVIISLATAVIQSDAQFVAFLSSRPTAFLFLGLCLILLARRLRQRFNKPKGRQTTGHFTSMAAPDHTPSPASSR